MVLLLKEAVFTPDMASPRAARAFVRRTLDERGLPPDAAVLLVSELATNAVLHARTDFLVRVHVTDRLVRVEVQDANERPPLIGHTPAEATSGRGLHLVQSLASTWGVEGRADGKIVWFELPSEADDRERAFAS
jgi:anti-sigma regulatory factor (Ser/Thr protein kinase)